MEFFPFLKTRNNDDGGSNVAAGIPPLVLEVGREEQTIARLQRKDLAFHLIFQFAPQAKHELMSRVGHCARSAVGAVLKRQQERLHSADKLFATQPLEHTACEGNPRTFVAFEKDNLLPLGFRSKK